MFRVSDGLIRIVAENQYVAVWSSVEVLWLFVVMFNVER